MADGRAKVQSAPIESNDVVRKLELDKKLDKTAVVQTTGDSENDVMSQNAVSKNFLPAEVSGAEIDINSSADTYVAGHPWYFFNSCSFNNEIDVHKNLKINEYISILNPDTISYENKIYLPVQTGTVVLRPNDLPTETSLVTVSSTGTHAYKKVSEVVDTKSEQTLTGTKTWKVNEPGITKTLAVSASSVYSKTDYSDGTRQSATFFSGGINLNKSTESNPIGDYTSIGFPYLVNHTDDVYKLALAPDAVPTEPSVIVNATDRHVTWKPLSEFEVSVLTQEQVDLLF